MYALIWSSVDQGPTLQRKLERQSKFVCEVKCSVSRPNEIDPGGGLSFGASEKLGEKRRWVQLPGSGGENTAPIEPESQ